MNAKKTVKKKTAAKKAAKVMANAIDSIIETTPEPVLVKMLSTSDGYYGPESGFKAWMDAKASAATPEPAHEVFDEDDYNPYAPKGFGGGWEKEAEDIIMPPDEPEPQPVPVEKPSLPSVEPVKAFEAPPVAPSPTTPPDALTDDALIVQRLINGINHLYGIARLTKGQKGPQPDAIARIQTNIIKARELITRLS